MITEIESPGSRSERLRRRRRRRAVVVWAIAIVASVVAATMLVSVGGSRSSRELRPIVGAEGEGRQVVTLVAMRLHDAPHDRADSLTLFSIDRTGRRPIVLFVPTRTLAQVPAFAYTAVGEALSRTSFLQRIAVENLLGVHVDRIIVLDDVAMGSIIDGVGGVEVEVTEDVYEANARGGKDLVFQHGVQQMKPAVAVTYMTQFGVDNTELDRFPRMRKVWDGIFASGPQKVRAAALRLGSGDLLAPADATQLSEILSAFAARPADERSYEILPVESVISGGADEAYSVMPEDLDRLARRSFPASMLGGVLPTARPAVEVRNGVGRPGAGERASALLVEDGIRVAVGANAPSFDYPETRIVVYGDDERSRALAQRIRRLLGRGTIEVGVRGQTVVQATIVIGRDFVTP